MTGVASAASLVEDFAGVSKTNIAFVQSGSAGLITSADATYAWGGWNSAAVDTGSDQIRYNNDHLQFRGGSSVSGTYILTRTSESCPLDQIDLKLHEDNVVTIRFIVRDVDTSEWFASSPVTQSGLVTVSHSMLALQWAPFSAADNAVLNGDTFVPVTIGTAGTWASTGIISVDGFGIYFNSGGTLKFTQIAALPAGGINELPVANAGSDLTVNINDASGLVHLNGIATDIDGTVVSTLWTPVSAPAGGTASITNTSALNSDVTFNIVGNYTLLLTATDDRGESSPTQEPALVTIYVVDNLAPTVTITSPADYSTFYVGDVIPLQADSYDMEDGDSLSFSWTASPASGISFAPGAGIEDPCDTTISKAGQYVLTVRATDSGPLMATDSVTVNIMGNGPAQQILDATGVKSGLVVHVGCGDGTMTAELGVNSGYVVHGLDADINNINQARTYIRSLGLYGKVSVEQRTGGTLPYIDNLVNLVVSEDLGTVPMAEVMRVLAPHGVAYIKEGESWVKTVKPWPADIDEWRQYQHDADNNAVAQDTVVGPPRYMQWTDTPAWGRSHMSIPTVVSMVSSKGRLFSVEDRASVENPFLPGRFSIVARGAFNGVNLWSQELPDWEPITRYIKDINLQMQRRLVAIDDVVYFTPGLNAAIKAYDAGNGNVLKVYQGTEDTQELVYYQGVIYAVIGDRMNAASYDIVKLSGGKGTSLGGTDPTASFDGCGFDNAYTPESTDISSTVCDIVAIDADTGQELWRKNGIADYNGCSLSLKGANLVYQSKSGLFCLDPVSGTSKWTVNKSVSIGTGLTANPVVLSDDVVYAKASGSVFAYSMADGSFLWSGSISGNYQAPADLFIANGALWTGGTGAPIGRDLMTGAQISQYSQTQLKPMGHDRCYRNWITDKYFINSKTGGADFIDLNTGNELPNYWVRGVCGFAPLPCNGLLYSTPFSCTCSLEVMMKNINALYAEPGLTSSDDPIVIAENDVLETGPSHGYIDSGYTATDWPVYRHDGQRSGATTNTVPAVNLVRSWQFQLTDPSALTIEGGKVFVSDIDTHTIYCLDAVSGAKIWDYVVSGRVDSPPTYHKGLVIFGSKDGWVYCLKASDGTLSWRFKGLPDKVIGAFNQLESAWPVSGSVLIQNDIAYFSAGRNSFVDGGIFHYGLNPETGAVVYRSHIYGPFQVDGFPAYDKKGYKSGLFVTDGTKLYLRHKAFDMQLNPQSGNGSAHVVATAGFLDRTPQHRTSWAFDSDCGHGNRSGEMLVRDGNTSYEMTSFPMNRHSYFDPRKSGYQLFARGSTSWDRPIDMTTKAMLVAGDTLFVSGNPVNNSLVYSRGDRMEEAATYEASYAGKLRGLMWAMSKTDGTKLAEYSFDSPMIWDSLAAADGRLYFALENGKVMCMADESCTEVVDGCKSDMNDLGVIADHWMTALCNENNNWCYKADVDHLGSVDFADILILADNWLDGSL
jgi:outer membrane protein assembly factor BamB